MRNKRNKMQIQKRAHNDTRRKEVQMVSAPLIGAMNLRDRNIQEYYSMTDATRAGTSELIC